MTGDREAPPPNGDLLQRSEARLAMAQAVAHVGSWELELATRRVWGSDEAFRIYGLPLPPDRLLPLELVQRSPLPEYRPLLDESLARLVAEGRPYDLHFRIRRHDDGAVRSIHSKAQLVRDAAGRATLVAGTLQDVTEQEAATRTMVDAIRASHERARVAFERAADAILVFDGALRILEANQRAAELTGLAVEALPGRLLGSLFPAEELAARPFRVEAVLEGRTVLAERRLRRADGALVPVEMSTRLLSDGLLHTILRDVTERRRLEEQLQLRQRMDSVGTLASGIAHDFNNVLVGIMGYADLLDAERASLSAAQLECVDSIMQASRRAADLVQGLQLLTHPRAAVVEDYDLAQVADEVWGVLKETTDRLVVKEQRVPPGRFHARGSASALYHALMNLGVNAVQAVEARGPGAEGRVALEARHWSPRQGDRTGLGPGRWIRLSVSDSGVGMEPQVRDRAFDPLFTTKEKGIRKGQGLGLAMVYNVVVRQHGGAIDVESTPGQGTTFHLYLPAGQAAAVAARPAAPPEPVAVASGTILVVDDEPAILRLARRVLEPAGYQVLTAADGMEAVEVFERRAAEVDLVVLDRTMPRLSGEQVLARLRRTRPGVAVVVSSGDAGGWVGDAAGLGVLQKPFTGRELLEAVAAARARSTAR